ATLFTLQAEDGIRDDLVTVVQTCALPISLRCAHRQDCSPSKTPHMHKPVARSRRDIPSVTQILESLGKIDLPRPVIVDLVRRERSEERRVGEKGCRRIAEGNEGEQALTSK